MKIALVGAGGYAQTYLSLLHGPMNRWDDLVAVIDPFAKVSPQYDFLRAEKKPIYESLDDFYRAQSADLVIISSPIPFHEEQIETAFRNGSHVLCEKPVVPTLQQAYRLEALRQKTGLQCGVGFQWSFSPTIQAIKRSIREGAYGRPLCLKVHMAWPRDDDYYNSSTWKGRVRDTQGRLILDAIASNAGAHYLHNMLFLMGDAPNTAKLPQFIQGSLYRARPIESFDTCFLRGEFDDGCPLYYFATHASDGEQPPRFSFRFEHATITMDGNLSDLFIRWHDGRTQRYDTPATGAEEGEKILQMERAIHTGEPPACGLTTAMPHLAVVNALFDYFPIQSFPQRMLHRTQNPASVQVQGLYEAGCRCYEEEALPDALGYAWATPSGRISLEGITGYQGRLFGQREEGAQHV